MSIFQQCCQYNFVTFMTVAVFKFNAAVMDSFYRAPRQGPTPPTIDRPTIVPTIPEVSIINNSCFPPPRAFQGSEYKTSVRPQDVPDRSTNRDAFYHDSSSFYKKQVRFQNSSPEVNFGKENVPQSRTTVPDLNGKTFKQIYMANVPHRHVDLSIFEPPQHEEERLERNCDFMNISKKCSGTGKEKIDVTPPSCNNDPRPDSSKLKSIENKITSSPRYRDRISKFCSEPVSDQARYRGVYRSKSPPRCTEICTQTEPEASNKNCTAMTTSTDEPTIRDLFRIIQQQNEQIMLLQRQVNNLKTSIRQPEIPDSAPHDSPGNPPFAKEFNSPTKKGLFSFDVKATSFEFSFRPQHNKFRKNNEFEPRIQEIVECDNATDTQNDSLHLDESLHVQDSYVSNVPSIAIEMDDYRSSDDDEEPEIGLTFYKDLMSQVNNVLKKTRKQSECQDMNGQAMKAVQQATLQHLQNIGVNLSPIQESSEVTGESGVDSCAPSEINCVVQQLLMKYLPPDKLAKVANKPPPPPKLRAKKIKPTNAEFSFATLQYMEKYNLIQKTRPSQEREKRLPQGNARILDVTALKLQPKLL